MAKIKVHEFVSLDGVFENPAWTAPYGFTPEMGERMAEFTGPSTTGGIILGRKTYQMFAPAWSTRTADDDPGAPFFNDSVKHVVSSTTTESVWSNTSFLGGYDAEAIAKLKADAPGDIFCSGSGTLVRAMLSDGLVDELHLFLYPVTLGSGAKLFPEGGAETSLGLVGSESFPNGVVHLTYGPAAS
jgi:dihydrofolate reductase